MSLLQVLSVSVMYILIVASSPQNHYKIFLSLISRSKGLKIEKTFFFRPLALLTSSSFITFFWDF
jgi:hypothetical protein